MSASLPLSVDSRRPASFSSLQPKAVVVAAILLLAHLPLLFLHIRSLSEWSDYQFFPYAILASSFLAVLAFKTPEAELQPENQRPVLACLCLLLSWLILAFGLFVISSPRAGALALLSTVAAVLFAYGKTNLLKRLVPAIIIYCMIIPLPWNIDQTVVSALQSLTAIQGGRVLDALGIPNIVQAHSVKLPSTTLQVEEGCSGINSLFTILITAILYVCWMKRPFFRSCLLLVTAVGGMLTANVLRVVSVGILAEDFHLDWSSGWRHEVIGLAYFGLSLLLVGSMDQFLLWISELFPRIKLSKLRFLLPRSRRRLKKTMPAAQSDEAAIMSPNPAVCFSLPVGFAFGTLVIAQLAWVVPTRFDSRSDAELIERVQGLPFQRLATVFSSWEQKGKPDTTTRDRLSPFGKYSIMAGFQVGDQSASLELDYPFFGWHNLTNCYALRGWEVQSSKTLETQLPGQHEGNTVEQSLARGIDEKAYLLYSIHDSAGRILKRPEKGPSNRWLQAHMLSPRGLNIHLCSLFGIQIGDDQVFSAEPEWFMPTLQIQVLVKGLKAPDEATKKQARIYFDSAREVLLRELSSLKENKP